MSGITFDIKQLLQLIYLEVYEGISPFIQYTKGEQGMEIRSVKIRAGNIPFDSERKVQISEQALNDPLLAASNVWQLEMNFGEKIPENSYGYLNITANQLFNLDTTINKCILFYPLPVNVLQNAGSKLYEWLHNNGIDTIGQLCQLSGLNFNELMKSKFSSNLLDLKTKAKLLEICPPQLPTSLFNKTSLYDLARFSEKEILAIFPSGTIDVCKCKNLLEYLGMLTSCLNDSFLKTKTIDWLKI